MSAIGQRFIVNEQGPAFSANDVLGLVKALRCGATKGSQVPAAVLTKKTVRVVFHHRDSVSPGDRKNRLHLASDSSVMNNHDSSRPCRDSRLEQRLIQIQSVAADIHKHGTGASQHKRVHSGNEGEGWNDYLVTR